MGLVRCCAFVACFAALGAALPAGGAGPERIAYRLATFSADVTIPLNHRCMGVLPTKSRKIADPLRASGFVLTGQDEPIVFVAVDWCEVRNGAYDQWREELAKAAGTSRERVLVCSLHQHDAPVTDAGAAQVLAGVGLGGELYDERFQDETIARVAGALREGLSQSVPVTHLGMGQALVEQVASNRRMVHENGRVAFDRGSRSGGDEFHRQAPEGEIDPYLKTLSFWNEDHPVLALSVYATHPMSYYGAGEVSADFVGLARQQRQEETPGVKQIYASGCSGDVTTGKYNDGSPESRQELIHRMHTAMTAAWEATRKVPLEKVSFRNVPLQLEFSADKQLSEQALVRAVKDASLRTEDRILAAMGLSSRRRVATGQPIDFPCIDFGPALLVLFPGESFVGYQLMAQKLRPDAFVVSIGYGECWPGYIPTEAAFGDGFTDKWLWVARGSEARLRAALELLLNANAAPD